MVKKSVEKKMEVKEHESESDEEMKKEMKKKPRAKKVRTEEQIKADKDKMAKLRALKGKK